MLKKKYLIYMMNFSGYLIFFSKSNAGIMISAKDYLLLGTSVQVSDVAHGPLVFKTVT